MRFRSFASKKWRQIKGGGENVHRLLLIAIAVGYRLAALRNRCLALPVTAMPLFLFPLLGVS
jgi:hypothetical protein